MASSRAPDSAGPAAALLVCHAGAGLGIGHLTRMLALADALERTGMDRVELLVQGERLVRSDLDHFPRTFIGLEADLAAAVLSCAEDLAPGVVVFDLHPRLVPDGTDDLLGSLAAGGLRLVAVDGLFDVCDRLDIAWIPSFAADPAVLEACTGEIHHGWDSYLIRKRLPGKEWRAGSSVLVLTGGSDVTGQARTLPTLLEASLPPGTEIHWVRGPFAPAPVLPPSPRLAWSLHQAPEGLDELAVDSGYALTVFGVTLFELLQYGVPTVVYSPYTDMVQPELELLGGEDVAVVADTADSAVTELARLMGDAERAEALSRAALDRLRVGGADRLAGLIHSLF